MTVPTGLRTRAPGWRSAGRARTRRVAPARFIGSFGGGARRSCDPARPPPDRLALAERQQLGFGLLLERRSACALRTSAIAAAARRALAHSSSVNVSSRSRLQRARTPSLARPSSMKSLTVRGSGCGAQAASAAASRGVTHARSRNPDSRCLRIATGTDTLLLDVMSLRKAERTIARGRANAHRVVHRFDENFARLARRIAQGATGPARHYR